MIRDEKAECEEQTALTVPEKQATANYVPAAAVIRRWRALSGIIGRKARAGGFQVPLKSAGLNPVMGRKLGSWSIGEESGIPSVAVKCVEIRKNTGGEGDFLDEN